jgi:steroid delta-isomerase-like uncharacterized protein
MAENTTSIARRFVEYTNAQDIDAFVALHADDFELTDTATGETFHGPEGARKNLIEGCVGPFPDLKLEIVNLIAGDDWVAIEGIGRGTHTGPLITPGGDLPATGRSLTLPFCRTLRIRGGKIVSRRDYYNVAAVMEQLGLMPEPAAATT